MISYYGHSDREKAEANALLRQVRAALPDEAWTVLQLSEAEAMSSLDREIAREFGIEGRCRFRFSLIDKERAHRHLPSLIAAVYRIFGAGRLVVTWELDSIVPPP